MSLSERQHTGEFLLSEGEGTISRETATFTAAASTRYQPGHVLGLLTATGKWVEYDNAGSDGSESAYGVLYGEVDNTANLSGADFTVTVIRRLAEVRKADLQWFSAVIDADKTAAYVDLATQNIIARD